MIRGQPIHFSAWSPPSLGVPSRLIAALPSPGIKRRFSGGSMKPLRLHAHGTDDRQRQGLCRQRQTITYLWIETIETTGTQEERALGLPLVSLLVSGYEGFPRKLIRIARSQGRC